MRNEILFITTYPPRQCGIATYSQDLIKALNNKFDQSFTISICSLETNYEKYTYIEDVKYILDIDSPLAFVSLAKSINANPTIQMVLLQHEFGFFERKENDFLQFLTLLTKPIIIVFHTVLPKPNEALQANVQAIAEAANSIVVMTHSSSKILLDDYKIPLEKITVIPHGTHLVPHADKEFFKNKYDLLGKKVLSTFGLLGSGKSIETTLDALPQIIAKNPEVIFLIIGKTHPSVVKHEGEQYRQMLKEKIITLELQEYVKFINDYLPLSDLLEYLQLTDIYLFTSKDPHQAVSGTFSYAISCGCPIISTPIPHAREVLRDDAGIIIDFGNSLQLGKAVNKLLADEQLRKNISSNSLHRMASTAWENVAIAHAMLFEKIVDTTLELHYNLPAINFNHIKKLTTDSGLIQFSRLNQPDITSGYTLDDNARALIVMCQYLELTKDDTAVKYINIYFDFIKYCLQPEGYFLNYVDEQGIFTPQNNFTNLEDSNGRAVWALGYLISMGDLLPKELLKKAEISMQKALSNIDNIHSTRAMGFVIKGLYYFNTKRHHIESTLLITKLANRLVQMYRHESEANWSWFEGYLTYANSILPEAMLCAWLATDEAVYKSIAKSSFDFLLSKIFTPKSIKVISNKGWLHKKDKPDLLVIGGEQPIDIAYTILALNKFYHVFMEKTYQHQMEIAFSWFLGNNHLHQIIYNPCTGGCYDGLEENYVNLNQGAESTISYHLARLTLEKSIREEPKFALQNMEYALVSSSN